MLKSTSLAHAKAHISALVDAAEHRGQRTVIHRHGKPAAAIVPLSVALPHIREKKTMSLRVAARSVAAFVAEFSRAEPHISAVDDLVAGRR
jgi:prevent-host-death family protein